MNEVKKPKKPLIYYYGIVLVALLLFNFLAVPWLSQRQVKEVDYGTFMTMTEEKQVGKVEVQDNQILFTDKEEKQRLQDRPHDRPGFGQPAQGVWGGVLQRDPGTDVSRAALPADLAAAHPVSLWASGSMMSKRMMKQARRPQRHALGGKNSSAKVYVKSSERHQILPMWPERTRPRRT